MNLPNKLTIARIAMTVLMVVFLLLNGAVWAWLAAVLFVAASLTDMADGRIARSRDLVTNFGKFMDPLADKILNYSVMILLIPERLIPTVAVVIILFREFLVSGIRLSAAEQGRVVAANIWGKLKTLALRAAHGDLWGDLPVAEHRRAEGFGLTARSEGLYLKERGQLSALLSSAIGGITSPRRPSAGTRPLPPSCRSSRCPPGCPWRR